MQCKLMPHAIKHMKCNPYYDTTYAVVWLFRCIGYSCMDEHVYEYMAARRGGGARRGTCPPPPLEILKYGGPPPRISQLTRKKIKKLFFF